MASIYTTTANDYSSHFRSISITDSGTFKLADEAVPKLSVYNDGGEKVRVYKTENHTATTSGTSNAVGVFIGVEDGVTFNVAGIGNADQISVQMETSTATPYDLKYIVFK